MKIKNNYSSFWMDEDWDWNSIEKERNTKEVDLIRLASYRRAIANFVNIVTNKNIPVSFTSSDTSFTNGKAVTLSSNLDEKNFDSSVGLALHEGSHILLSDFDFLKHVSTKIPDSIYNKGTQKGYDIYTITNHVKTFLNLVEDRRIDNHIFTTSPGYKGYYHTMYDTYFNHKLIDKALKTDEYTDETWDSYLFRAINITNPNTNLNALKGLKAIWNVLDLKNISRLKTTEDAFNVALSIVDIVLDNIVNMSDNKPSTVDNQPSDMVGNDNEADNKGMEGKDGNDTSSGNTDGNDTDMESKDGNDTSANGKESLTDKQRKQLEKAIKAQTDFMSGSLKKKRLSQKNKSILNVVEQCGMTYKEVGNGLHGQRRKTKCVVINKLTKELIANDTIHALTTYSVAYSDKAIQEGLRLGTILGKKLKVRTESRDTKYTRKENGKIDKRLIAELGFNNSNVFNQIFTDSYPDAFLHISIDASGSMSGHKWNKTLTAVVAIVKAIDMIEGIEVVVSFRATQGTDRIKTHYPSVLIGYDSRIDHISKVKLLWSHIRPNSSTPEGLCYEALLDTMVKGNNNKNSYFLNFSDGEPMFDNVDISYHHETALNHTKKMVKKIKEMNIKVLSYFISDSGSYGSDTSKVNFKHMYGNDSEFINVTSITDVAKSMNKRFLSDKNG